MPVPRNTAAELEALEQLVVNVLADLDRIRKQGKPGITRAVRRLNQVRVRLLALKVALVYAPDGICPECGCGYECGCVEPESADVFPNVGKLNPEEKRRLAERDRA